MYMPSFWNFVCQPRTLFQDEVFLPSRGALTIKNKTHRTETEESDKKIKKRKTNKSVIAIGQELGEQKPQKRKEKCEFHCFTS